MTTLKYASQAPTGIYQTNTPLTIVGTMTGTSIDGLDLALVDYHPESGYQLVDFKCCCFDKKLQQDLFEIVQTPDINLEFLTSTHFQLARFAAKEITKFVKSPINLISFPGQTVRHLPQVGCTLQIGSAGVVAALTGITTVGDFRSQDIALGGQGAPLVPFVDQLIFKSNIPRILLNIGGIANLTYISEDKGLAFDTGPGNIVINDLVKHFYNLPFDEGGKIAKSGKIQKALLEKWLYNPYFQSIPPKSTGRKLFGDDFIREIIATTQNMCPKDIIATATMLTIETIVRAIDHFISEQRGEMILSGGGAHNNFITQGIAQRLENWRMIPIHDFGITEDSKEAFAFAVLAHHTAMHKINHWSSVTGCPNSLVLGAIYYGVQK